MPSIRLAPNLPSILHRVYSDVCICIQYARQGTVTGGGLSSIQSQLQVGFGTRVDFWERDNRISGHHDDIRFAVRYS